MVSVEDKQLFQWYAARTRHGQELHLRTKLSELGFECFIPSKTIPAIRFGKRTMLEVPIIANLIFIRATKTQALSIPNGFGLPIWYLVDRVTNSLLVIPDKQMEDFIRVYKEDPSSVVDTSENLVIGGRVRVIKGNLSGIEGNLVSFSNKTYVVVALGGEYGTVSRPINALMLAKVKIPKSSLVSID